MVLRDRDARVGRFTDALAEESSTADWRILERAASLLELLGGYF